ncbi:hypothetical protein HAX54_010637, partial [Datura stramonium]|nr:hypothetical protein [Datura stramonium]
MVRITYYPFPAANFRNPTKRVLIVRLKGRTVFQKDGPSIEEWTRSRKNGIFKVGSK